MQDSVSLGQDEIDSYRRLRSSDHSTGRFTGLLFQILVMLVLIAGVGLSAYFYDQTNINIASLEQQVADLTFENRGFSEINERLFEYEQDLKEIQGEVDRVWNLASKEQVATFESIRKDIAAQKSRLDELQEGLATLGSKAEEQVRLQRSMQSIQASIVSLDSSYQHATESIDKVFKQDRLLEARIERNDGAIDAIDKDRQRRARKLIEIEKRLLELEN